MKGANLRHRRQLAYVHQRTDWSRVGDYPLGAVVAMRPADGVPERADANRDWFDVPVRAGVQLALKGD